jgi:hypothetical protein
MLSVSYLPSEMSEMDVATIYFDSDSTFVATRLNHKNILKIDGQSVTVKYSDGKSYEGQIIGRSSKLLEYFIIL